MSWGRKAELERQVASLEADLLEQKEVASLESVLRQVAAMFETVSGIAVNPENAMQSPTVKAIVTAVQNRVAVSPIRVMQKSVKNGREVKEPIPDHPIAKLLKSPNRWQTQDDTARQDDETERRDDQTARRIAGCSGDQRHGPGR